MLVAGYQENESCSKDFLSPVLSGFSEPRLSPLHSKCPADRDTVFRQVGKGIQTGGWGGGGASNRNNEIGIKIPKTKRLELKH